MELLVAEKEKAMEEASSGNAVEQRRYSRLSCVVFTNEGLVMDMGMGGVRLSTRKNLEPGERISLEMPLFLGEAVRLKMRVVWCRQSGAGRNVAGLAFDEEVPDKFARFLKLQEKMARLAG